MSDRLTPLLDAVVARIASHNFAVGNVTVPVIKRKAVHRHRTLDEPTQITVAKSAQAEQTTRRRFGLWQTTYAIDVIFSTPHTGPETNQGLYASMRDTIVDDFKQGPIVGAPFAFDWDAQAADWLRPFGDSTEWDWFACRLSATVAHA